MNFFENLFNIFSKIETSENSDNPINSFGLIDNYITWYCDCCNSVLNEQDGFDTENGYWECAVCGFENDVTDSNIFSSEEAFQEAHGIPKCPYCGSTVIGEPPDALHYFKCHTCRDRFYLEDGELLNVRYLHDTNTFSDCSNCGQSLKGGQYTAPWENGNNPDGFIKCPHCGYINFFME